MSTLGGAAAAPEPALAPTPALTPTPSAIRTDFASLAEAALTSTACRDVMRRVQARIMCALEGAGFNTSTWAKAPPRPMLPSTLSLLCNVLKVFDPLSEDQFEVEVRCELRRVVGFTRLNMVARVRDKAYNVQAQADIAYKSWDGLALASLPAVWEDAFQSFQAPDGIADGVFGDLVTRFTCAVAP